MSFYSVNSGLRSVALPVVVGEFEIISREEHLAILQPYDVGFWDALSHAGEHSTAPYWLGNGLRPLQELRRGWGDKHRVPANRGDALIHNVIKQTRLSKATCNAFRNMSLGVRHVAQGHRSGCVDFNL